ncbi:MAG: hypothetical protein AVDCRST_MAG16-2078 [uncultured Frankineae bacterium]|uniref:Uncharacterized protein n=1 Tax=uncultured Frankineae bacterium TaxID=437475 RepID=A0A6J4LZZ2_9ACTN|nr:MAG: hypothetical protein AVDCRST_MAG16-2078 [uncultured Frankineae bacterium]
MRVADAVQHLRAGEHAVGRAVAVVEPHQLAGVEARRPATVEPVVAVAVVGAVDDAVLHDEVGDPRALQDVVDDLLRGGDLGTPRQGRTGPAVRGALHRADADEVLQVQRLEAPSHDHPAVVRSGDECLDDVVVRRGGPGQQRAVRPAERREPHPCHAVDALEVPAGVDGRVRDRQRPDPRGHPGPEALERAGRGAEGCDLAAGHAVDGAEVPPDVDARAVRRGLDHQRLRVEHRSERQQLPGGEVEGEDVGARHLLRTSDGRAGGPGRGELAHGVHRRPDDLRLPDDAVDLDGRERVGARRHGGGRVRRARVGRGLRHRGQSREDQGGGDEPRPRAQGTAELVDVGVRHWSSVTQRPSG